MVAHQSKMAAPKFVYNMVYAAKPDHNYFNMTQYFSLFPNNHQSVLDCFNGNTVSYLIRYKQEFTILKFDCAA